VNVIYPTAGLHVPGNGGFCAWVTATGVDTVKLHATWGGQTVDGVLCSNAVAPCTWAYSFQNVGSSGTTITMTGAGYLAGTKVYDITSFTFVIDPLTGFAGK
jgi:hypothetical protein